MPNSTQIERLQNSQNELYLTDLVSLADAADAKIDVLITEEDELAGVNDRSQLAYVEAIMQSRLRSKAMASGVTLQAPETVFLSADTMFGTDMIEPHVIIGKGVSNAWFLSKHFLTLKRPRLGKALLDHMPAYDCSGTKCQNYRGNKECVLQRGQRLTLDLGDAKIGEEVNIGAGTITCNYDGVNKFTTTIEKGAASHTSHHW